jgi:hypothetical protein
MHFDDDEEEWRTIEKNLPQLKLIKVDDTSGRLMK